jgi:hypothetical protein
VTQRTTSAPVALLLPTKGIIRVRPLEGGIDAWLADNFPSATESLVKKPAVLRDIFSRPLMPLNSNLKMEAAGRKRQGEF